MKKILYILLPIATIFGGCNEERLFNEDEVRTPIAISTPQNFADPNLNQQAKDLYTRLIDLRERGIAFGQQVPFGIGNNFPVNNRLEEDFFEVTGDHPAVVGFDLELIALQPEIEIDGTSFLDDFINKITNAAIEAHENGSIVTFSWHQSSFRRFDVGERVNYNGVVKELLEGGMYREEFVKRLSRAARLFKNLVDSEGNSIPVLFRPWHEMNGDFFFWGADFRSKDEYVTLWKDTIRILSEDFDVHNLLYVYAPNWVSSSSEYLRDYPGDAYVDMLGIDVYDFRNRRFLTNAIRNLRIVEDIANDKNMLFALTETGLENVTQNNWWTDRLYKAIRSSSISYAMTWRNDNTSFFHVPFLGHPSEDDFRAFLNNDLLLLRNGIQ